MKEKTLADLRPDRFNFNRGTFHGRRIIEKSLRENGAGRSILIDKDDNIISGNQTVAEAIKQGKKLKIVDTDPDTIIAVRRSDLSLYSTAGHNMALADNVAAFQNITWDKDTLTEVSKTWSDFYPREWDRELPLNKFKKETKGDKEEDTEQKQLYGRAFEDDEAFHFCPTSIFNFSAGFFYQRAKEWRAMGIRSELGRKEGLTGDAFKKSSEFYTIKNELREILKREPTDEEVYEIIKKHGYKELTGTSVFNPALTEIIYRWYNIPGGSIFDPFAGGSVRGIVAARLHFPYTGIDLREEQIEANKENAREILGDNPPFFPDWYTGDSANMMDILPEDKRKPSFDLLFSCPPYGNLEEYSTHPNDISSMVYDDFVAVYTDIIQKSTALLKRDRFAVFVVGDYRDAEGTYRDFIGTTVRIFKECGLYYHSNIILQVPNVSGQIYARKRFVNRRLFKNYQNALVFFKGNANHISRIYPPAPIVPPFNPFDPNKK